MQPTEIQDAIEASTTYPAPNISEAQVYNHVRQLLNDHEKMLADGARNKAFYQALAERVSSDSVVLDIGAGFGIWAITAARLGAKKVVAVESNELLVGVIKKIARECGVGDRVQPIFGYSTQLTLAREFDIVVSETIGFDGFDEAIIAVMSDARSRFLKPGGVLIPETLSLYCAPAHFKPSTYELPAGMPLDLPYFAALNQHAPVRLAKKSDVQLLGTRKRLITADLYQATEPFDLTAMRATWKFPGDAVPGKNALATVEAINCFVVWVESRLSAGVRLSTRKTTSWTPLIYRFENQQQHIRQVDFSLGFTPATVNWGVGISGAQGMLTQHYAPKTAAKQILLDLAQSGEPISTEGQGLASFILRSR